MIYPDGVYLDKDDDPCVVIKGVGGYHVGDSLAFREASGTWKPDKNYVLKTRLIFWGDANG